MNTLFQPGDLHPCPTPKDRQRLENEKAKCGQRTAGKLLAAAEALQEYMDIAAELGIAVRLEGDDHRQKMVDSMAEFGRHLKAKYGAT